MKKKKEYDDILKRFYLNLSLLSPESFYFNQHLTELMLPYIQNFVQSGEKCDFGFRIKNESSSELTGTNQPLNSILVPTNSSSHFDENNEKNEIIFDNNTKYNEYVKNLLKQNPIYSNFRKEIKSQLYYKSSQRIIFLAICHLIRPKIIKKLISDQKKENQDNFRAHNVYHANLDSDGPGSFINTTMRMDYKQNSLDSSKIENSISFLKNEEKVNSFSPIVNKRGRNGRFRRGPGFTEITNSILIDDDVLNENVNSVQKNEEKQNIPNFKSDENKKTKNVLPLLNINNSFKESEQIESDTLTKSKEEEKQEEVVISRSAIINSDIINEKEQIDADIKEGIHDNHNHLKSENKNSIHQDEDNQISSQINIKSKIELQEEVNISNSENKNSLLKDDENPVEESIISESKENKTGLTKSDKNNNSIVAIEKHSSSTNISSEITDKDAALQKKEKEHFHQPKNEEENPIKEDRDSKEEIINDNSDQPKSEDENLNPIEQASKTKREEISEENSIQKEQNKETSEEEISKNDDDDSNFPPGSESEKSIRKEPNNETSEVEINKNDDDSNCPPGSESEKSIQKEPNNETCEVEINFKQKSESDKSAQIDADSSSCSSDDLSKTEIENSIITEDQGQIYSPLKPSKRTQKQDESSLSIISNNEKSLQKVDENQTEANTTFIEKEKSKISYMQTDTELFEYSDEETEFDFDFAKSRVFDELSLSFFEMRTNMCGRLTRSTELLFEKWSQISCCLFFEFISSEFSFFSLKNNSSFVAKFEDFARSLVQGFVSAEKQSYHDGVMSLLPFESRYFFVRSLVTLDSLDREDVDDQQEKSDNNDDEKFNGFESMSKLVDNKYYYYHHRSGIAIDYSSYLTESTAIDSTLNTTTFNSENRQTSVTNFLMQNGLKNDENNQVSQKVESQENDFSVSKFMNPLLASYRSQKNESVESFSMKIMLAKAVHDRSLKESRVLFDSTESSPLISRALELRGVTPPRHPPDPSDYSPRKLRKSQEIEYTEKVEKKKVSRPKNDNEPHSPRAKKKVDEKVSKPKIDNEPHSPRAKKKMNEKVSNPKIDNEPHSPRAKKKVDEKVPSPKPKIKVSHVNSNSKNSFQSNSEHSSLNDTFYTFNRKMKEIRNEKKAKNKSKMNDEKRFQIRFNTENLNEKKKPLKTSIRRAQLAESKGFIVREKAIEQHNREVLNTYEERKRAIYRDICSSEAKCAEEIEKCASNGNLIMHSNLGKSVLYDKLEKNIRNKQINKSFDRLNGRKVGYGMEYDTDYSQLEGPIATAILEDGLF